MADGRVLAVDYGQRRIGVAISDPLGLTAQGLPTLRVRSITEAVQAVQDLASRYDAEEIVVGLPLRLSGSTSRQTAKVKRFVALLEKACQRPVILWDERYTSLEAERALRQMGRPPSRHRDKVDQLAAVFILQGYLDRRSSQKKR